MEQNKTRDFAPNTKLFFCYQLYYQSTTTLLNGSKSFRNSPNPIYTSKTRVPILRNHRKNKPDRFAPKKLIAIDPIQNIRNS